MDDNEHIYRIMHVKANGVRPFASETYIQVSKSNLSFRTFMFVCVCVFMNHLVTYSIINNLEKSHTGVRKA
jgi:hypothetical protein